MDCIYPKESHCKYLLKNTWSPFRMGKGVWLDKMVAMMLLQFYVWIVVYLTLIKIYIRIPSARLKLGPTVVPNTVTLKSIAPWQTSRQMQNPAVATNIVEAILSLTTKSFCTEVVFSQIFSKALNTWCCFDDLWHFDNLNVAVLCVAKFIAKRLPSMFFAAMQSWANCVADGTKNGHAMQLPTKVFCNTG